MLTSIVPNLPPAVNGLGDYAFLLAEDLQRNSGIPTHFLVADERWVQSGVVTGFTAAICNHRPEMFANQLPEKGSVILHYVNYGYQRRGCPVWLADGLTLWKKRYPGNRLITVFHEVYAFGAPWTSSFWLSPLQRHIAARLFKLSDEIITSMNRYREALFKIAGVSKNIYVMPVVSNVGEPDLVPPLLERKRQLVVFGGAGNRSNAYKNRLLADICDQLSIEEILDIGPRLATVPAVGTRIIEMGRLPAQEVSNCLLGAMAGFVDYPVEYVPKSGIFAAYCSHGVVPVMPESGSCASEGINEGEQYLSAMRGREEISLELLQGVSRSALLWYARHSLGQLSRLVSGFI